jgi:hypothetical protein
MNQNPISNPSYMKINIIVNTSRTKMSGTANPIATGNDAIFAARVSQLAMISPAPMSVEPRYPGM